MQKDTEAKRLREVNRFLTLDFDISKEFTEITALAAELCETPVALITLLDKDINWIKVRTGFPAEAMPRETSFCQYTVLQDELLIIPDTTRDERFTNNPLVNEAPHVRFYAGAPLTIKSGVRLGSLCLFHAVPHHISATQQKVLSTLARQVTYLMELELNQKVLLQQIHAIEEKNNKLSNIAHIQSHEIRQPLTSIMGIVNLIKEDGYIAGKDKLLMLEEAAHQLDSRIHAIVDNTSQL